MWHDGVHGFYGHFNKGRALGQAPAAGGPFGGCASSHAALTPQQMTMVAIIVFMAFASEGRPQVKRSCMYWHSMALKASAHAAGITVWHSGLSSCNTLIA